MMKTAAALIVLMAAAPAAAQTPNAAAGADSPSTAPPPQGQGFDLMGQGADLLVRGLLDEMQPAMDQFGALAQQIGPAMDGLTSDLGLALAELLRQIDNIRYYQAPQILANGDILIRRSPDAPPWNPPPP